MFTFQQMLNIKKTEIMMFGPRNTIEETRRSFGTIKGATLAPADAVKSLGVWLDYKLGLTSKLDRPLGPVIIRSTI